MFAFNVIRDVPLDPQFQSPIIKTKPQLFRQINAPKKLNYQPITLKKENGETIKVKTKIFPQSYEIDAALARRILEEKNYPHRKLDTIFLYRGDTRAPDGVNGIFNTGFYRKLDDRKYHYPKINECHASSHCISTSKDLVYAVGFADERAKDFDEDESWVYLLNVENGIDLTIDNPKNGDKENVAKKVNEVALTGIPADKILAAFKIKATNNELEFYFNEEYKQNPILELFAKWQIPVIDFKINENCKLKQENPKLYAAKMSEFQDAFKQGYFEVPNAPKDNQDVKKDRILTSTDSRPILAPADKVQKRSLETSSVGFFKNPKPSLDLNPAFSLKEESARKPNKFSAGNPLSKFGRLFSLLKNVHAPFGHHKDSIEPDKTQRKLK